MLLALIGSQSIPIQLNQAKSMMLLKNIDSQLTKGSIIYQITEPLSRRNVCLKHY